MKIKIDRSKLPPPPKPPLVWMRSSFFGADKETESSKIAGALYEGQRFMWCLFMAAIDGSERPFPMANLDMQASFGGGRVWPPDSELIAERIRAEISKHIL